MVLPGLSLAGKQKHAGWASLSRCMGHGDFVFRISLFQHLLDMNFTESVKVKKYYYWRFRQRQHSNTIVWIFLFSCSLRWVKPNTTSFVICAVGFHQLCDTGFRYELSCKDYWNQREITFQSSVSIHKFLQVLRVWMRSCCPDWSWCVRLPMLNTQLLNRDLSTLLEAH